MRAFAGTVVAPEPIAAVAGPRGVSPNRARGGSGADDLPPRADPPRSRRPPRRGHAAVTPPAAPQPRRRQPSARRRARRGGAMPASVGSRAEEALPHACPENANIATMR